MGCGASRIDDSEALAHCLERSGLLANAIRHRYALADAHAAYAQSLRSVGDALHGFLGGAGALPPASPVLPLPAQRKGDPMPPLIPSPPPASVAGAAARGSHSRSHSGSSHINFHSSGSEDDDDIFPFHSSGSSPIHLHPDDAPVEHTYVHHHYARNQPPPSSVSYELRPRSPETVQFGSVSEPTQGAFPYSGYPYPTQSSNFYSYSYPYMNDGGGGMGSGGFYGSSSPPPSIPPPAMAAGVDSPSTSRAPPPPPSPPRTSTWDFLNPFDAYDSYYAPYSPNRSSKEVREEEGIPDLEDEEHEVVKEAYGDQKFVASTSAAGGMAALATKDADGISSVEEEFHVKPRSVDTGSSSMHEVHVVEKSVVTEKEEGSRSMTGFTTSRTYRDISEVVQEIKNQFDRASESAGEVSKILEVGKLPYHQKDSIYKELSARMVCGLPSPWTSKNEDFLLFEEEKAMGCGNLSSTMQKLYMWEKKLLEEVKAEEKMRVLYDRKREQLKYLSERGAEAEKFEALQTSIRKLSTKIKVAIQVVDTISNNINRMRDEELWPQICELIQGLMKMWRAMLECHHIQFQAISGAQNLDSIVSAGKLSDAHMGATKQLEMDLLDWVGNFSAWVAAQRGYVKCLNGWLVTGLHYVPEVTDDGIPPFSPGRLGAPPVFVICNHWSQSMDRISERDVIDAMQAFASTIMNLWEKHKIEHNQRLMATRDMDRNLRLMEREEQQLRKAVEAQNKKLVMISNQSDIPVSEEMVHLGFVAEVGSLQQSLKQIFEAMENYTGSSMKMYEEIHL